MKVKFIRYASGEVLATVETLHIPPKEGETVTIFGEVYRVYLTTHSVDINLKKSGKRSVKEVVNCHLVLSKEFDKYLEQFV